MRFNFFHGKTVMYGHVLHGESHIHPHFTPVVPVALVSSNETMKRAFLQWTRSAAQGQCVFVLHIVLREYLAMSVIALRLYSEVEVNQRFIH